MSAKFLAFLLVGRLIIFFVQAFPAEKLPLVGKLFQEGRALYEWKSCDLCLGFWVYLPISYAFGQDIILFREYVYFPVISEIVTAMAASLMMHIFAIGWITKFGITVVE